MPRRAVTRCGYKPLYRLDFRPVGIHPVGLSPTLHICQKSISIFFIKNVSIGIKTYFSFFIKKIPIGVSYPHLYLQSKKHFNFFYKKCLHWYKNIFQFFYKKSQNWAHIHHKWPYLSKGITTLPLPIGKKAFQFFFMIPKHFWKAIPL